MRQLFVIFLLIYSSVSFSANELPSKCPEPKNIYKRGVILFNEYDYSRFEIEQYDNFDTDYEWHLISTLYSDHTKTKQHALKLVDHLLLNLSDPVLLKESIGVKCIYSVEGHKIVVFYWDWENTYWGEKPYQ